jgi:hypothetical protein
VRACGAAFRRDEAEADRHLVLAQLPQQLEPSICGMFQSEMTS